MQRIPEFIKWLVITVVSLALLTTVFFIRGQQQPDETGALPTNTTDEVKTLLVQLARDDKSTSGLAILVNEEKYGLRVFNISPSAVSQFGEAGLMTMAEAGTQVAPAVVAEAVSTATGIRIDGTLTLQRLAVAGLVDSIGGISVNPSSGLLVSELNATPMYVPPGEQLLDGQHAAGYAMIQQFTEVESQQISRMNQVLKDVFGSLPSEESKVDETIAALGSLARSNISTSDIAKFLVTLNQKKLWANAEFYTVITDASELELMPDSKWLRVRQPDNWNMLAKLAPRALMHFTETDMRIEVTGESPVDRSVLAGEIAALGFNFIDGGYSQTPLETQIRVSAGVKAEDVENLRNKLGLPDVPISWDFTLAGYADVRIVIGVDYRDRDLSTESVN